MRKMLKFAVLGAMVGAGIVVAKTTSEVSDPAVDEESTAVKAVGGGAALGALLGLLLDRRSHRRAQHVAKGAKVAATVASVAKATKPHLERAAEATRGAALTATEAARAKLAA